MNSPLLNMTHSHFTLQTHAWTSQCFCPEVKTELIQQPDVLQHISESRDSVWRGLDYSSVRVGGRVVLLDELLVVIIKTSHKDFLQYLTCCVCVLVCTCVCTCLSILHLWSHTVMQTLPGFLSTAWSFRRCCRCLCSLLCFVQVRLWQKRVWMCADICNSDLWWMDLCCVGLWLNLMVKLIKARQQLCNRTVHSQLTAHNFHQVITSGNEF